MALAKTAQIGRYKGMPLRRNYAYNVKCDCGKQIGMDELYVQAGAGVRVCTDCAVKP